jgi:hypothetical protein
MAGLPFLSRTTSCFLSTDETKSEKPKIRISSGMMATVRYRAALLSLHRALQCGEEFMGTCDVQACSEKTVLDRLTP